MTARSADAAGSGLDALLRLARGDLPLDVGLRVRAGTVAAIVGPNGAGKTTAVRALAGLLRLGSGHVRLDGDTLDDPRTGAWRPPEHRAVSVVFQDHLLFPHLSALDNVAFGVRARGSGRQAARRTAGEWLDRVGLAGMAARRPAAFSGGEAQRVALARALAPAPRLLLLDEPLAALDAGTRASMRRDLRRHLADFGGSAVVVTHDPLDAFALATHLSVLESGSVTQSGPLGEVTRRPRSPYVAELLGVNLLRGMAHGTTVTLAGGAGATMTIADPAAGPVHALVHPHAVALHTTEPTGSPRNRWPGRIEGFDLLGDRVRVRVGGDVPLVAEVTAATVAEMGLHDGQHVWAAVKATEVETYAV